MKRNKLLLALLFMTIPCFDAFSIKKRHFSLYQPTPFSGKWPSICYVSTFLKEFLPHHHPYLTIYTIHIPEQNLKLYQKTERKFFMVFEFKICRCVVVFPLNSKFGGSGTTIIWHFVWIRISIFLRWKKYILQKLESLYTDW